MKSILALIVVVLVAAGAWYFLRGADVATPSTNNSGTQKTYTSDTYGISFQYPDSYRVEERDEPGAERTHHSIVLMDKDASSNIPEGGEGPTTINIDIFQNNLDNQSVEDWIKNSNPSNYKLSPDGVLTPTSVADQPALAYVWDGLYRGNSIVFEHKENIVMLSVTYMTAEDQILNDFAQVVASMQLK